MKGEVLLAQPETGKPKSSLWRKVGAAAALLTAGMAPIKPVLGEEVQQARTYAVSCETTDISLGKRVCTYKFEYTQTMETFIVPPTNEPVEITTVGAPGASDKEHRSHGAEVTGSFPNIGGLPLFVTVGGEGYFDGYNGGEQGGGGGASDVRLGFPELENRIIVAGGGGAWGDKLVYDEVDGYHLIIVKGGDAGQSGSGYGGQPGNEVTGGAGGGSYWAKGEPGTLGKGGRGGDGVISVGGGGGGGFYGGGGGGGCEGTDVTGKIICTASEPGSGGGGSSLVPPGGTMEVSDGIVPSITIKVTQYNSLIIP